MDISLKNEIYDIETDSCKNLSNIESDISIDLEDNESESKTNENKDKKNNNYYFAWNYIILFEIFILLF